MDEILVNFGYSENYGEFGIGFKANRGVLQPLLLQGSLEIHQGHEGNEAVLGCTSLFEVKKSHF